MPGTKKRKKGKGKKKETSFEPPSDKYVFDKQEMILCFHGPALYKAKVLKRTINRTETGAEEPMYYIHYHGWNQQWDEWVSAERCLKLTEENIEKQQELNNENKAKDATNKTTKTTKTTNTTKHKKHKKNKKRQIEDSEEDSDSDTLTETNNTNNTHLQSMYEQQRALKKKDLDDLELNQRIKSHQNKAHDNPVQNNDEDKMRFKEKLKTIIIPTALKDNLVEQYNLIHEHQKLIKLPKQSGFSIDDILNDVLNSEKTKLKEAQEKKDKETKKAQITVVELLPYVIKGIKGFFRNTLKINLLYNFEKLQYEEMMDKQDLCSIYGAEHLIRLFYILPNILLHTPGVEERNFGQIKQCLSVVIQYLNKNKGKYLIDYTTEENVNDYVQHVTDEYIAKSEQMTQKYYNKQ